MGIDSLGIEQKVRTLWLGIYSIILGLILFTMLRVLVIPFICALVAAYLLLPLVLILESRAKVKRIYAVVVVMLFLGLMVVGAVVSVIPIIKLEIDAIVSVVPQVKQILIQNWWPWFITTAREFGVDTSQMNWRSFNLQSHFGTASTTLGNLFSSTSGLLGGLVNLGLIPFFLFFILLDLDLIKSNIKALVPGDLRSSVHDLAIQIDDTLKTVIKGQLTVAAILGLLYAIGFSIVGLNYSLAVGLICGLCRVVPYLDAIAGVVFVALISIADPSQISWAVVWGGLIVIAIIQAVDGMLITPRVIGDRIGLHPAVVICAVIAFADWFGFWGVLIALPATAVIKIITIRLVEIYRGSDFFKANTTS